MTAAVPGARIYIEAGFNDRTSGGEEVERLGWSRGGGELPREDSQDEAAACPFVESRVEGS